MQASSAKSDTRPGTGITMQLSSKGRYAVMAMADMATAGDGAVVPLASISARQHISLSYLEQLFAKLRRAGLVESMRGPGGGYLLARPAAEITLAAVMVAVDEPVKMTRCTGGEKGGCVAEHRCLTHDVWRLLGDHIVTFLSDVTLGDIADNAAAREAVRALHHDAHSGGNADKAKGLAAE